MRFSAIIIGRKLADCQAALLALAEMQLSTGDDLEILVSLGENPSRQRNEAAAAAAGEYLLFLDDDSVADSRLLHYYKDALSLEPGIGVVGGPSVFEEEVQDFRALVQEIFCSAFGLGPFRARYMSLGRLRQTTEQELILCNLLIERKLFSQEEGFHPELYPNEENEFLNRLQKKTKIYYHPLARCSRSPRESFFSFVCQMLRYGEGRAKHLRLFPNFWDQIFLAPLFFTIYICGLFIYLLAEKSRPSLILFFPLALYFFCSLSAAFFSMISKKSSKNLFLLPPLFFSCHFFYGLGLLYGFFKHSFRQPALPLKVEVVKMQDFRAAPNQGKANEIRYN